MAWTGGEFLTIGLVFLFFWLLVGQYWYREARKRGRTSPELRGLFWGVFGVVGVFVYLVRIRRREKDRLIPAGASILLFAFWAMNAIGPAGPQEHGGWYAWAGLFAGLFVLYWQFHLETAGESGGRPDAG